MIKQEQQELIEEAMEDGRLLRVRRLCIWDELLKMINEYRKPNCPCCHKGYMQFAGIVPEDKKLPE